MMKVFLCSSVVALTLARDPPRTALNHEQRDRVNTGIARRKTQDLQAASSMEFRQSLPEMA